MYRPSATFYTGVILASQRKEEVMEQPKNPDASSPPNGEAQAKPAPAEDAPSEIKHEISGEQPGELTPDEMRAIQAAVTTPAPQDYDTDPAPIDEVLHALRPTPPRSA
jgi:hypothetical protein